MNNLLLNETNEPSSLQSQQPQPPNSSHLQHHVLDPDGIPQPVIPNNWNSKDLNYSIDYYQQSQLVNLPQPQLYYQPSASQSSSISQPGQSQLGQLLKRSQTPQGQGPLNPPASANFGPGPSNNSMSQVIPTGSTSNHAPSGPAYQDPMQLPVGVQTSPPQYPLSRPKVPNQQQTAQQPTQQPHPPPQHLQQPPQQQPQLQYSYFSSPYQNMPMNLYNYPTYNNYEPPVSGVNYSMAPYHYDYDQTQAAQSPQSQNDGHKRKRKHTATVYNMTPQTAARNRCPICQKQFKRPSSLQVHIYSHTGEKLFKCPWESCGKYFSVKSNMNRHYKLHQRDVNKRNSA